MTFSCYSAKTPFVLTPRQGTIDTLEIQYVIRGSMVVRQQPLIPSQPVDPDTSKDEAM